MVRRSRTSRSTSGMVLVENLCSPGCTSEIAASRFSMLRCAVATVLRRSAISGRPSLSRIRSEEHTSELQSLMRISYAVFCLKKKNDHNGHEYITEQTAKHQQTTKSHDYTYSIQ